MNFLKYRDNLLYLENASIEKIAKKNVTPFYLYSFKQLEKNFTYFKHTFASTNPTICFAVKSNPNLTFLKKLRNLGSGADVVSMGELQLALKAGIHPSKIVFSGVGKTNEELTFAITKKILLINTESENEIDEIIKIAKNKKVKVAIGIRINPDIAAKTNKKISTGKKSDKFGISINHCEAIFNKYKLNKFISIQAISVHIGSQIKNINPFEKTLKVVDLFLKKLKQKNIKINYLDIGGGMGIPYSKSETIFNLTKYGKLVEKFNSHHHLKIIFEPGRYISANTGLLVARVVYIKKTKNINFIILDAGMNDLMRPALYDAKHEVIPVRKNNKKSSNLIEFVGPICESTDRFITYKKYQHLKQGDLVCFTNVGAYGRSLSSTYNIRPLAGELAVQNTSYKIIRPRQKLKDLIK